MYRADGYRIRSKDPMYEIVPYIMPKRYDASNSIKYDVDLERMQEYARTCRKDGVQMSHMGIIIAAYLRVVSQNPQLNRFCVNKKIYARNHFCVSFVTLRPGDEGETVCKIYFNLDDDIFTVNEKINNAIEKARSTSEENSMDKLMTKLLRIPFLTGFAIGALKLMDKLFTLPFSVIDASPFHTSLFVTNLASLRTNTVFHHLYDFGTTGIFCSIGQPMKKLVRNGENIIEKKVVELGIVTDERIADGHYYARCFKELKTYFKNPELLEKKPEKIVEDHEVSKKKKKFIVR